MSPLPRSRPLLATGRNRTWCCSGTRRPWRQCGGRRFHLRPSPVPSRSCTPASMTRGRSMIPPRWGCTTGGRISRAPARHARPARSAMRPTVPCWTSSRPRGRCSPTRWRRSGTYPTICRMRTACWVCRPHRQDWMAVGATARTSRAAMPTTPATRR